MTDEIRRLIEKLPTITRPYSRAGGNVEWIPKSEVLELIALLTPASSHAEGDIPRLIDRLEQDYALTCPGGPLSICVEWQRLKAILTSTTKETT